MKILTKALCLILVFAGVVGLYACGAPVEAYEITLDANHGQRRLTIHCDYTNKFTAVEKGVIGIKTAELVSETDSELEDGRHRTTLVYDLSGLSQGKMTIINVRFMGKNDKDTVALLYRVEIVQGYIVVKAIDTVTV